MRADDSGACLVRAAFWVVALAASHGLAAEPPVSLRWVGAGLESGCLGQRGLERAVSEALGRDAFSSVRGEREVVVWVDAREGVGFRALIRIRDSSGMLGERELVSEGPSCATLDEPLAFAVALMVDTDPVPAPAPAPAPGAPPERSPIAPAFRRFELGGALLGVAGVLPEPTLGVELGAEVRALRWLGVRAHVGGLLPRARMLGPAEGRFGLFVAGAAACPGWRADRFGAAACLGFEWGALTTGTRGFESDASGARRYLAGAAMVQARYRLAPRLWLVASGGVLLPHARERFTYTLDGERRTAFEMSAVCPRFGFGAAFEL